MRKVNLSVAIALSLTLSPAASQEYEVSDAAVMATARYMASKKICIEFEKFHSEYEMYLRVGEEYVNIYRTRLATDFIESGSGGKEVPLSILRYFDYVFEDGPVPYDRNRCETFGLSELVDGFWVAAPEEGMRAFFEGSSPEELREFEWRILAVEADRCADLAASGYFSCPGY